MRSETRAGNQVRDITRRGWLRTGAAAVLSGMLGGRRAFTGEAPGESRDEPGGRRGRVRQSVCRWCFDSYSLEELARHAKALGIGSVELVPPEDWPVLKKHGLICAMTSTHGFTHGLNRRENHDACVARIREGIDATAEAGFPNVITFSGMRRGLSDEEGIANTVEGAKKVVGHAEKKGVTICLEVLNSRVDENMKGHPDYMADRVEWAVEVCDRVGSERFKILFDIYHVQIMQGDVITRIREFSDYIGHFHTAGVPGRGELDEHQELQYPPILRAALDAGVDAWVGQEFIPTADDPMASLRDAVRLCDV